MRELKRGSQSEQSRGRFCTARPAAELSFTGGWDVPVVGGIRPRGGGAGRQDGRSGRENLPPQHAATVGKQSDRPPCCLCLLTDRPSVQVVPGTYYSLKYPRAEISLC